MISNGCRCTNNKVLQLTISLLLLLLIPASNGALYPFGIGFGDTKIDWNKWELGSEQIQLETSIPLLGDGKLSDVWINTIGALTYRQLLTDSNIDSLVDNIALAPYYIQSQEGAIGAVYYRQTTTASDLQLIEEDVSSSFILPPSDVGTSDFKPTFALVVTWSNVASVQDSTLLNSFQIVLTTDGSRSFAIYNYDDTMQWGTSSNGSHAAAGIFVTPNTESICNYELQHSQTEEVTLLPQTIGNNGALGRFILVISEPLPCSSKFQSACEEALPSSDWGTAQPYFSISGESWDIYAQHTCNGGFEMRPGVSTERINCDYEPDYYSSEWEKEATKCLDLTATKSFEIELQIVGIANDTITDPGNMTDGEKEELEELVVNAITRILNMKDIIVTVINITTDTDTPVSIIDTPTAINVTVKILIPPYIYKKITAENITTMIKTAFNVGELIFRQAFQENVEVGGLTFVPTVTVTDSTDPCLQGCICRLQIPPRVCPRGKSRQIQPDSCCGGCNGKPYSSTIKACCNNERIYDPAKSKCCNGRIRKESAGKCPTV